MGPEESGPVLTVSGGGKNTFTAINSATSTFEGIIITNSNNNVIDGAEISCSAELVAGPGILLTQESENNSVTHANIFVLFGNGIEVDLGSDHNLIQNNTVVTATSDFEFFGIFAMLDENPNCDSNIWTDNSFSDIFAPGQISANQPSCIH